MGKDSRGVFVSSTRREGVVDLFDDAVVFVEWRLCRLILRIPWFLAIDFVGRHGVGRSNLLGGDLG